MSHPTLDLELTAALQVLEHELGPLQGLDVRPTPPRRPAIPPAPAPAGPDPPGLFGPPPTQRWRAVLCLARPLSPTSSRPGGTADELV
jgi:hypothetical protein